VREREVQSKGKMPDPCMVTVKAGPQHSRGYESLVSGNLAKDKLQEITSNLPTELKAEALVTFLDAVKDGLSIAACVSRVQDQVLQKVPNERSKFFVKFVYDNQLQIEIGVNKFKNGNAQYYHRLGVQPRENPAEAERKTECIKHRQAMQELRQGGSPAAFRLKKQVTNDRSAPLVSVEQWATVRLPPNATNKQTARDRDGLVPEDLIPASDSVIRRPKGLGPALRNPPFHAYWDKYNHKMQRGKQSEPAASLRSRSLGRPKLQRQPSQEGSQDVRERSASPLGPGGTPRRGLGDCFRGGIRPSQARLQKASPSPVGRKVSTGTFELERDLERERLKNVKVGEEILKKDLPDVRSSAEKGSPTKFIKIVIQAKPAEKKDWETSSSESSSSSSSTSRSSSSSSLAAEWRENCLEIEEMPESPTECMSPALEVPHGDSSFLHPIPINVSKAQEDSWSPSPCKEMPSEEENVKLQKVEFLQPSTVFLTETEDGMVEEPFDSDHKEEATSEYPIQNFRNRAQRQEQPLQPIFKKAFGSMKFQQHQKANEIKPEGSPSDEPVKQSSNLMDCSQSMGPFFSQPFKPVQVQQWREGMEGQIKSTFHPTPSASGQVGIRPAEASNQLNFQPTHATSQLSQMDFGGNSQSDNSGWVSIPIQRL